ncbi:MAG TPA: dihydrofolate reductase family protein [Candidatus Saccharimonadia bacterium]|nr:dihydrofolate reductase family protein [Candidatus Saccharimonadia bacterium]
MNKRPYVIISSAQSLDGYLDDGTPQRLILSNDEDFDQVDALRASVDAILVGAGTIRADNPRLLVRSAARQQARTQRQASASPTKVTLLGAGELDPAAAFFTAGSAQRLVYTTDEHLERHQQQLHSHAAVVSLGAHATVEAILADLAGRGVRRLLVEGGSHILSQFFASGLVDELRLATASFFVGDSKAPRFAAAGPVVWGKDHHLVLEDVTALGDVVVAHYLAPELDAADRTWMKLAFEASRKCPPTDAAYSVGAVIVGADGREIARGYSRETGPKTHAEEVALAKVAGSAQLAGATLYSTLEPCSARVSQPTSCAQRIVDAGLRRVVYGLEEPLFLQDCQGAELLQAAGLTVRKLPDPAFAAQFRHLNEPTFARFESNFESNQEK